VPKTSLSNANLRGATLDSADLRDANLFGADLSPRHGGSVGHAMLSRAALSGADLRFAT
jgi:uncharacterized protein YjbI with pentapeptide repeats